MNKNNILALLGLLTILQGCSKDEPHEERNSQVRKGLTYVPDDAFEQHLIGLGYDDVLDDYVITASIADIQVLVMEGFDKPGDAKIRSLEGIQDFKALEELEAHYNLISDLDLSNNKELVYVGFGANQIKTINLSQNLKLDFLELSGNPITSLDLSQNKLLSGLRITHSTLENLDLSDFPLLNYVQAYEGELVSIDISGSPIMELNIWGNNVNTLRMEDNPDLERLFAEQNALNSIDISGAVGLVEVGLDDNNLTSLDLSPIGAYGVELRARNNPDLRCIKVAEGQYEQSIFHTDDGVAISEDCSDGN